MDWISQRKATWQNKDRWLDILHLFVVSVTLCHLCHSLILLLGRREIQILVSSGKHSLILSICNKQCGPWVKSKHVACNPNISTESRPKLQGQTLGYAMHLVYSLCQSDSNQGNKQRDRLCAGYYAYGRVLPTKKEKRNNAWNGKAQTKLSTDSSISCLPCPFSNWR
jgi:hypothetical protein